MTPSSPHQYFAYRFTPCCDPDNPLYFTETSLSTDSIFKYIGTTPFADGTGKFLIPDQCYYIELIPAPPAAVLPPPISAQLDFIIKDICNGESIPEGCPSCNAACYYLIPCDSVYEPFYSDTLDLQDHLNQLVNIEYNEQSYCVYVTEGEPDRCADSVEVIVNPLVMCSECVLTCYYISDVLGVVYYVDADLVLQSLSATDVTPYIQICSYIEPRVFIQSEATVVNLGVCDSEGCPEKCFVLTNCETDETMYSTTGTLIQYALGNSIFVKLAGYEGCWKVEISDDVCNCPVDVTVINSYVECIECTGYKNYKLTNCDTGAIKYTSNDLSAYIGKTVLISENDIQCPGCWSVTLFEQAITSDIDLVPGETFDNCKTCQQEYWLLEDCAGIEPDIITITDLSIFEDEYIRLTWCPETCWHVTSTKQHTNPTIVFLEENYTTCAECLIAALPCICVNLKNNGDTELDVDYYDCDGVVQTVTLNPGELSSKLCIKQLDNPPVTIVKTEFGNCTGTSPNFTCPVIPTPRRVITPGYNTPGCSTQYYETVLSNFSSWIYGEVLKQRYGISPCCSEDAVKWEIKQQMLEFTAALNPEYTCTPSSTCCSTPSSCNCN